MKRLAAAILALFAVMTALTGLFSNRVEIPEADLSVEVPAGWLVMTRSTAASESTAARFAMTVEEAQQFMQDNDFYLVLFDLSTGAEIYLTVFGSQYAKPIRSLDQLPEEQMMRMKETSILF